MTFKAAPRICRNPHCAEWVERPTGLPLCASCRLAGSWGAAAAFVVFFIGHVLASVDWWPIAKAALGWVFHS